MSDNAPQDEAIQGALLVYSCSGASNVAELADLAARELMAEGYAMMFCLAGLGAAVPSIVRGAKDAEWNILIDGCGEDCGRKIFDQAGIRNYIQVRVTDLGIAKKGRGARATDAEVVRVVREVRKKLPKR